MLEKHLFSLFKRKPTCLGMTHCRSVWKMNFKKFPNATDAHKKNKKSVHFWVSAEAWSAWCFCLSKGTEKTAELLNRVVFIRGFQWSEPSQQLFTSLPIASKHIMPICNGRNSEVKFSSDGGAGDAQGTGDTFLSLLSVKVLGTRQEWGSPVPSLPFQTLSGLWKMEVLRNTEALSAPHSRKGSCMFISWGTCACSVHWITWGGRHRAITDRNLKAPFSGVWSGNQLCQIFSKYLYHTILQTTWKQVILLWLQ